MPVCTRNISIAKLGYIFPSTPIANGYVLVTKSGCGAEALTPIPNASASSSGILVTRFGHVRRKSCAFVGPITPVPMCGPEVFTPLVLGVWDKTIPLPFIQLASVGSPPNLSASGNITVSPIIP